MKKRLGTAMAARLLLLAATCTAFQAPRRHAALHRLGATSTTTTEMFDSAEAILQREATLKIGNLRFTRVLDADDDVEREPLLYVPGIEFRGISVAAQLPNLIENAYDPWYCWVDGDDRSSFDEVVDAVATFVRDKGGILAGESMGGLIATAAALKLSDAKKLDKLRGVALINPATSYDRTPWPLGGRLVSSAEGVAYAGAIGAAVGLLASDGSMVSKSLQEFSSLDFSGLERAVNGAQALADLVPPETLKHRVENWLDGGCAKTNERLWRLRRTGRSTNFLVICGEDDRFLPSKDEAERLKKELDAEAITLRGGGHAVLVDPERLDFGKALRSSKALYGAEIRARKLKKAQRAVDDFIRPNATQIKETRDSVVDPLRRLVSPKFFSTVEGEVVEGLRGVPSPQQGRPVLLVGNHQLFGADLSILVDEFLRDRDLLIRGLAHPVATNAPSLIDGNQQQGPRPSPNWWDDGWQRRGFNGNGDESFFQKFGAVEVTPRNFIRLLQRDECVLLFPGGVRESNHGKGENNKLFWPEETDFVRAAAKYDALIVPFGAVGAADSVTFLRDKTGEQPNIPSARRWANRTEDFRFPLAVPTNPRRFYFRFGEPIATSDVDASDRDECARVYAQSRSSVESSIAWLLEERKRDAFDSPLVRLPFEAVGGGRAQAPTFSL
jgi:pimeloyl-ACP methyl ester carboxylesterase